MRSLSLMNHFVHTHARTHAHTHTHTHARTHAHTHTHTHMHTHTTAEGHGVFDHVIINDQLEMAYSDFCKVIEKVKFGDVIIM